MCEKSSNGVVEFSYDWIIKDGYRYRAELLALHKGVRWDLALVKAYITEIWADGSMTTKVVYRTGNPLLGGIRDYKSFKTAQRKYNELLSAIIKDEQVRAKEMA